MRNTKKESKASGMSNVHIIVLIWAMIALVFLIGGIIVANSCMQHRNESHIGKIDESVRYMISSIDSSVNKAVLDSTVVIVAVDKAVEYKLDAIAELLKSDTSSLAINSRTESDINTFTSIILAMIALCMTMAVVIPYVIGKSITRKDIQEEVDKYAERIVKKSGNEHKEAIRKLELAEAHASRMTAYFLYNNMRKKHEKRPEWVIGWASKALGSYIKQDEIFETERFCKDCMCYITEAVKCLKNLKIKQDDELRKCYIRAIKDLYDASCFAREFEDGRNYVETDKLLDFSRDMVSKLISDARIELCSISKDVAEMSRFKEYMDVGTTKKQFIKKFESDMDV